MSFYTESIGIIVAISLVLITYFRWAYKYWEKKSMTYIEPSMPFGNLESPLNKKLGFNLKLKSWYDEFKRRGSDFGGAYVMASPVFVPVSTDLIKTILTKDFHHFMDHGIYYNEKSDPLSAHLFSLEGQKWKNLRAKLTPTFTSGKIKTMFQILDACGAQMTDHMNSTLTKEPVEIKEILACFTTDIIGSCAFGLECNSFKDPDAKFRRVGRKIFENSFVDAMRLMCNSMAPIISRALNLRMFPKDITDFFLGAFKDIVRYRESNNVKRNDFVQIMMDLNEKLNASGEGALSVEEMAAQALIFFIGGFETSSTTMNFCLYELSMNEDIQQKLRDEINQVLKKHDGKLSYEAIMEMQYMEQVIDETLRKYPPVPSIPRVCTKDYKIPGTDVVVEKGTRTFITTLGIHHHPDYFVDPETFDPERFSEENKPKIQPYTYLPFGEGPRVCIGLRFGMMQTKVGLFHLLKNYSFKRNEKTPTRLELAPDAFVLAAKGAILLDVEKV